MHHVVMARITFSISDDLQEAAEKMAARDRRSLSSYITGLVEKDARSAGLVPADPHAELIAAADEIGLDIALAAVKRASRTKKKAA